MQRRFKVKDETKTGRKKGNKKRKSEIWRNQKRETAGARRAGEGGGAGEKKTGIRRVVVEGSAVCQISIRRH